jgi:hypothetical protein
MPVPFIASNLQPGYDYMAGSSLDTTDGLRLRRAPLILRTAVSF